MTYFGFAFDKPWYLLLLALLPVLWWVSFKSLSGLGRVRRLVALALRTLVFVVLVFSLAEMQRVLTSEKLTVIYLLDQSESIPAADRQAMLNYAVADVKAHRNAGRNDKAGVIVFGRDASIEIAPFNDDLATTGQLETLFSLRTDATNLAAALKLAQASFPEDSARRVVIVSDGNENVGDARASARMLLDAGVGIDVVPIRLPTRAEVAVEKVTLPPDIRKGQKFDARVVVNNFATPTAKSNGEVKGTLKLARNNGDNTEPLAEEEVTLKPGKNVLQFSDSLDQPDFYTYEARFVPSTKEDDALAANNRATAFTHVRGRGHVLFIEDSEAKAEGESNEALIERLRSNNLEVTVQTTDQLFSSLAELQRYDTVVLDNVARANDKDIEKINAGEGTSTSFSDERIAWLVRNTQQMGSGLVMLGGKRALGAGGWQGTELEMAMPVDFTIKNHVVMPVGALVMVMHASEMPQGNYWQKVVSAAAIQALGSQDYCGIIHWNGNETWLWKDPKTGAGLVKVGNEQNRKAMLGKLDRMTPGDMPDFDPSMLKAANEFQALGAQAAVKHMILISDGDPAPPNKAIAALIAAKAQCTTVAVGTHGPPAQTPLIDIATKTGGKFYNVTNANALPKIYQREARRVAQPLIYEKPVQPQVKFAHEMVQGLGAPGTALPPIGGFVLTTLKENPLVEVSLVSPAPEESNATILASWTYGLGRTAVLTTDAGARWAKNWPKWENYDKLFTQVVRWTMRPVNDTGKYTIATDVKDGKVKVTITALDQDDEFLNFLNFSGTVVGPKLDPSGLGIRQVAPGRYVGEFDADAPGSYFLTLLPGAGKAPLRTGVSVPYSAEYRDRETNLALLSDLAQRAPQGGDAGELIEGQLTNAKFEELLAVDTFRHNLHKATSSQNIWPYLLALASLVFFADVFTRRVSVGFEWLQPVVRIVNERLLGRGPKPVADERMARLRSRKQTVSESIDQRRAQARFEPQPSAAAPPPLAPTPDVLPPEPPRKTSAGLTPEKPDEEDSYTSRLLRAKQQARKKNEE